MTDTKKEQAAEKAEKAATEKEIADHDKASAAERARRAAARTSDPTEPRPVPPTSLPTPSGDPVAESARRGAVLAAGKAAEPDPEKAKAEAEAMEKAKRSGGPINADPTKPPVDSKGEEKTHPPDLADNPPNKPGVPGAGGFAPRDITTVEDVEDIVEMIRTTNYADVLYYWRRQERESKKPRQEVIDLLHARLMSVQGPPLASD